MTHYYLTPKGAMPPMKYGLTKKAAEEIKAVEVTETQYILADLLRNTHKDYIIDDVHAVESILSDLEVVAELGE